VMDCQNADTAKVPVRPEDDILEQWRRRRRLELVRQRVIDNDWSLHSTSRHLVQPQVYYNGPFGYRI